MPYMKVTEGSKTKVYKKGPDGKPIGKALGTHDSEAEANEQIAAIEAGEENKEADHTKCGYHEDYVYVPWGITSFADYEAAQEVEEAGKEARKLTSAFSQIASNIMSSMDISNKAQALARLANEFAAKVGNTIRGKEKELPISPSSLSQPENDTSPSPAGEGESSLLIWKEGGVYKWVAAYSNNYRDEDNPPEIISAQSHKEFDQALEKGEWEMPELWPWHLPYRVGVANLHTFDEETGFTLAAGTFDKGMEWVAEGMIQAGWDGVSHGMPQTEIQKDSAEHIITRHRTREISPLPKWAAANKLSFNVISKESIMAIPAHKRDEFIKAFGADKVAEIEQALEGKAAQAKEAGIEQKEKEQPATPEATPAPEAQPEATTQPTFTLEDLAQAIGSALKPVVEEVKALGDRVKELEKDDATKIAEKAAATPAASLEAMIIEQMGGGLFSKAAQVDGRSSLAQSKPKETPAKKPGGLFFDSWVGPA